ncbi:MAG: TIGR03619 family F420-dependent LLM class oxidoreductase [Acidimicrobiia bacterium]|nr:TIGR03619 family F420-dependent LLM class oxidoreductase [Acidimicrobiia bacterium]
MRFGMQGANLGRYARAEGALELVSVAEEVGLATLWTADHVVLPDAYASKYPYAADGRMPGARTDFDFPELVVWMAYVAHALRSVRLATGVVILPQRNPLLLAKQLATLDNLVVPELALGIGVGWLEEECVALGVPWERRGQRTDEYVAAMRELWAGGPTTFAGEFSRFDGIYCLPRPKHGTIRVIVGGHTEAAARRAGRLGDGFYPWKLPIERLDHLLTVMRQAATDAGRDPATIEVIAGEEKDPDQFHRLADLGVTEIVMGPMNLEKLRRFGDEVIAKQP